MEISLHHGRIITIARADRDGDGDIGDGDEQYGTTVYQCFTYNNNLLTAAYPASTNSACNDGASTGYSYSNKRLSEVRKHPQTGTTLVTSYSNWDKFGHPQTITDPNNVSTSLVYDHQGRVLSRTSDSNTASYSYLGNDLAQVTNPAGDMIKYYYDAPLYGLTALHKLATVEHRTSGNGLIESVDYGFTVNQTYHTLNTTEQVKDASSNVTREKTTVEGYGAYDGATYRYVQVTEGVSGSGQSQVIVKTFYDSSNRPIARIEDPGGSQVVTTYAYNTLGQLTSVTNGLSKTTKYYYDGWGNLVGTTVDPGTGNHLNIQTSYVYDDFGRLIRTDSPDAHSTVYVYNATGTLAQKREGCASDGSGCEVTNDYSYDAIGRLTHVDNHMTDDMFEEWYVYDGVTQIYPDGGTNDGGVLYGGTNGKGRLTALVVRSLVSGETVTVTAQDYSYWPDGRIMGKHYQTLMHEPADAGYDTESFNAYSYWYNANGALAKMKYHTGRYVYYCLDGADPGKPTAILTSAASDITACSGATVVASPIHYYPFGDIKDITLANNQIQQFTRDKRGALTQLTDGYTPNNLTYYHDITYTYDKGDITAIDDASQAEGQYADHSLTYDNLHQLTDSTLSIHNGQQNPATYTYSYSYDAAGNRASSTENSVSRTYEYSANSNVLADIKQGGNVKVSFTHDDLGRMTVMTDVSSGDTLVTNAAYLPNGLMYNKDDSLQSGQTVTSGDTVYQLVMPNGEMIGKLNYSKATTWLLAHDPAGNLIVEGSLRDRSTDPVIEHIYLGNRIIASITGSGQACFIATVAFGSPLAPELQVYRAFRDRILSRFSLGRAFTASYYHGWGLSGAAWIKGHSLAKAVTRWALMAIALPLKVLLFGRILVFVMVFLALLSAFVVIKKLGISQRRAIISTSALAFLLVIGYSLLVEVPVAQATYSPIATYYYTLDHIGRPLNLRDSNLNLRWYEQHQPFGEIINEAVPNGEMSAGSGGNLTSWIPSFRFPGQFVMLPRFLDTSGR